MKETKQFQTESKELLNLMINSIYSNQEIFLRELISNASDAIDKYQYLAISSAGKYEQKQGEIFLTVDKKKRFIEIKDNGIGMDKDSLETNLGTIAKSGSKDFASKIKNAKEKDKLNIIGQFGVGFYSAFMVAQKVEVLTKAYKKPIYKFTSDGKEDYSIEDNIEDDRIGSSGTIVRVYLKPSTKEAELDNYLEDYTIKDLVTKYNDYVRYPIKMETTKCVYEKDKDGKEIPDKHHDEKVVETLNSVIPLWKKNKKDVKDKDLNEFYKNKFMDYEDPFASLFLNIEGMVSYNSLVFIPSHPPYDLYSENYEKGLDLYAKGIFIQSKCKDLIPDYLKFCKGLVDSNDFSLNISREILQKSPILKKISENIENKVISKLKDILSKDRDNYLKFFKNYGDFLKFGIYESYGTKTETLNDLLVYYSLNQDKYITLKEYKDSMKKDQKFIYFASGKSLDAIKLLPQIEKYKKDKVDVLLCDARIDEFCIMMMRSYNKIDFKNISEDKTENLSKKEEENIKTTTANNKRLLDNLSEALKGKIDEVTISSKLVDSPVCISSKEGLSTNMENVLNEEPGHKDVPKAHKVLELNPDHPIFTYLSKIQDKDDEVKNYASILFDEALLLEGSEISDKQDFIKKVNDLMVKALSANK